MWMPQHRSQHKFDVGGHHSRLDVFRLHVSRAKRTPISFDQAGASAMRCPLRAQPRRRCGRPSPSRRMSGLTSCSAALGSASYGGIGPILADGVTRGKVRIVRMSDLDDHCGELPLPALPDGIQFPGCSTCVRLAPSPVYPAVSSAAFGTSSPLPYLLPGWTSRREAARVGEAKSILWLAHGQTRKNSIRLCQIRPGVGKWMDAVGVTP